MRSILSALVFYLDSWYRAQHLALAIGSMVYVAQCDKGVRRDAAKIIADAGLGTHAGLSREAVFREPRLFGYLFFPLFLLILCAAFRE
jgi:hypothetical protein